MVKKRSGPLGSGSLSLDDVKKMVGKTYFLRSGDSGRYKSDGNLFFEVDVQSIVFEGCNIKAIVSPTSGMGTTTACISDLLTVEQADDLIEHETAQATVREAVEKVMREHYQRNRKAKFILVVEQECSAEEREMMAEECGGSLAKAHDTFIRNALERIYTRKYIKKQPTEGDG